MRILFTGGGTGGHLYPLVAVAREIRKLYSKKDLEFFYLGPKDEYNAILLSQEEVCIKSIASGKIRRYFSWQNIIDIAFNIPLGFMQAVFLLSKIKPNLVFSKGGSGSVPVCFAAKLLKIPLFIHESDVVPGFSNQIASKWARKIFVSFPKTEFFDPQNVVLTGNPIRVEILEGSKEQAPVSQERSVLLFTGGSQGAEFLNDFVLRNLNIFLEEFEIVHSCGINNFRAVSSESLAIIDKDKSKYYHLFSSIEENKLKHIYKASDLVIARSGSGTIFEISALGLPSILVPLPSSASDHQAKNAYAYSQTGAAIVMEQDNMTKNFFLEEVHHIFASQERLNIMREAAIGFSKPNAAKAIARNILEYLML